MASDATPPRTTDSPSATGYTGWLGGQLSYKHMFGVNPEQSSPDSPLVGSKLRH